jgi:hypothetical protein
MQFLPKNATFKYIKKNSNFFKVLIFLLTISVLEVINLKP